MADLYLRRVARVCPPRSDANAGGQAGSLMVLSATSTSAQQQLNTTLLQRPAAVNAAAVPGSYGRCLVRFHAENNDVWINCSKTTAGSVSSAGTSGATMAGHIPQNQDRDFELDPGIDLYLNYVTLNGSSNTANLRLQIVSFDTESGQGSVPNA